MQSTREKLVSRLLGSARPLRLYAPALIASRRTPSTRFVILTGGRTGSELLVSLLGSHPEIVCDGELLNGYRPIWPERYIAARAAAAGWHGAKAYGWKLLYSQFRTLPEFEPNADDFPLRLHERGYRIILLERLDLLQTAISYLRAQEQGRFHDTRGRHQKFTPLTIDPMALIAAIYLIDESAEYGRRIAQRVPHLRMVYEHDLLDPRAQQTTGDRVCRFLGVRPAPMATDLVKTAPVRTRDILANYAEIEEVLRGTRFAKYLNAGEAAESSTPAG